VLVVVCLALDAGTGVGFEPPGNVRRVRVDGHTGAGMLELIGAGVDEGFGLFARGVLLLLTTGWHCEYPAMLASLSRWVGKVTHIDRSSRIESPGNASVRCTSDLHTDPTALR